MWLPAGLSHTSALRSRPATVRRARSMWRTALVVLAAAARVDAAPHCPHECPIAAHMPHGASNYDCSDAKNRHCGMCLACITGTCSTHPHARARHPVRLSSPLTNIPSHAPPQVPTATP